MGKLLPSSPRRDLQHRVVSPIQISPRIGEAPSGQDRVVERNVWSGEHVSVAWSSAALSSRSAIWCESRQCVVVVCLELFALFAFFIVKK